MSQISPIDFYIQMIKEEFPGEDVDKNALSKAYEDMASVWFVWASHYLRTGKDIPPDIIKLRDQQVLGLYKLHYELNRLINKKSSK